MVLCANQVLLFLLGQRRVLAMQTQLNIVMVQHVRIGGGSHKVGGQK